MIPVVIPPTYGILFSRCAQCLRELPSRPVEHGDPANGLVSHGLCEPCYEQAILPKKPSIFRADPTTYQFEVMGKITEAEARAIQEQYYPIARYGFRNFTYREGRGYLPSTTWFCDIPASLD